MQKVTTSRTKGKAEEEWKRFWKEEEEEDEAASKSAEDAGRCQDALHLLLDVPDGR
jgi:hypothetical protein